MLQRFLDGRDLGGVGAGACLLCLSIINEGVERDVRHAGDLSQQTEAVELPIAALGGSLRRSGLRGCCQGSSKAMLVVLRGNEAA